MKEHKVLKFEIYLKMDNNIFYYYINFRRIEDGEKLCKDLIVLGNVFKGYLRDSMRKYQNKCTYLMR